jgi:hypothetical protein
VLVVVSIKETQVVLNRVSSISHVRAEYLWAWRTELKSYRCRISALQSPVLYSMKTSDFLVNQNII